MPGQRVNKGITSLSFTLYQAHIPRFVNTNELITLKFLDPVREIVSAGENDETLPFPFTGYIPHHGARWWHASLQQRMAVRLVSKSTLSLARRSSRICSRLGFVVLRLAPGNGFFLMGRTWQAYRIGTIRIVAGTAKSPTKSIAVSGALQYTIGIRPAAPRSEARCRVNSCSPPESASFPILSLRDAKRLGIARNCLH